MTCMDAPVSRQTGCRERLKSSSWNMPSMGVPMPLSRIPALRGIGTSMDGRWACRGGDRARAPSAAVRDCMALRRKATSIWLFCTRAGQPYIKEDGRANRFDSIWQPLHGEGRRRNHRDAALCRARSPRQMRVGCGESRARPPAARTRRGRHDETHSPAPRGDRAAAQTEQISGTSLDNRGLVGQRPRRKRRKSLKIGAPGEIQTPDHLVREEVLGFRKPSTCQSVTRRRCPINSGDQGR